MTKKMDVHFSSKTDDWETPQDYFDKVNDRFGPFDLDVCASIENAKCEPYIDGSIEDSLKCDWGSNGTRAWMNPPYGRTIGSWVKKAYEESQQGLFVVALLPGRTDTKWFHNWIYQKPGVEVQFIAGRLKFGGCKNSAPFPSMLVIFNLTGIPL